MSLWIYVLTCVERKRLWHGSLGRLPGDYYRSYVMYQGIVCMVGMYQWSKNRGRYISSDLYQITLKRARVEEGGNAVQAAAAEGTILPRNDMKRSNHMELLLDVESVHIYLKISIWLGLNLVCNQAYLISSMS